MLTQEELEDLLQDLESDRVERTTSTTKTDKYAEAICAFANDFTNHRQPGYLMVGVRDDGSPSDLEVTDDLLKNLAAIRADGNVQPLPAMTVSKFSLGGGDVAVVEVLPSDLPPVKYRGRVWIRVGPRRQVASEQEERILAERRAALLTTFDARPCHGASLDDLDTRLFEIDYLPNAVAPEIIEENHRSIEHQLAALRFFDLASAQPTNAGILLFGKDPLKWIPGAYIQFARFQGVDLDSDPSAENTLSGDLLTILKELEQLISVHNATAPKGKTVLREKQVAPYPNTALREFLMNAVMHRWYEGSTAPIRFYWFSDHIEIQSPGGLFGEATPQNFPNQNAYRNPVIAEAMKTLGFVNRFGRGVIRAQSALAKNGNPPAEFNFQLTYILVTMKAVP
jgi:ATP-dependent DNA helicase RecG